MMSTEAYIEWISLFSKETENAWTCEIKELRRAAMILCALKEELNSKSYIEAGFHNYTSAL